jgi:hypothetical protein
MFMIWGLGFRVWGDCDGSGYRIQRLRFKCRDSGLGIGIQGLRVRVWGSAFRIQGPGVSG